MATPKKFDVNSILSKAAQKTDAKPSKSKTPVVELPQHRETIDAWLKANADFKDAEARKAAAEDKFLADAEEARVGECRRDGKYYSSVKVNGQVTISIQNRYSAIRNEDYPTVEQIFGEKAGDYFKPRTEIALTEAALNDEEIMQKLITAVGPEKFQQYFNVKQFVQPTELLHESRAINPEIGAKANALIEQGILKPYKAAVKVG